MKALVLALSLALSAASPWRGSVALPPGSVVSWPSLAPSWPASAWTLDLWILAAPDVDGLVLSSGVLTLSCAAGDCGVVVAGDQGGEAVLDLGTLYPYSVYALRIEAEEADDDVAARAYLSGRLVDAGVIPGEGLAAAGPVELAELGPDHAFVGPLRLWRAVGRPSWLFQAPAPTDPDLVGHWTHAAGGLWVDEIGGRHGVLAGAAAREPLCWQEPRGLIFKDGFESGDSTRWW